MFRKQSTTCTRYYCNDHFPPSQYCTIVVFLQTINQLASSLFTVRPSAVSTVVDVAMASSAIVTDTSATCWYQVCTCNGSSRSSHRLELQYMYWYERASHCCSLSERIQALFQKRQVLAAAIQDGQPSRKSQTSRQECCRCRSQDHA